MLDTIKKFASTALDALTTFVGRGAGSIKKFLMKEKDHKLCGIVFGVLHIASYAFTIFVVGIVVAVVVPSIGNISIGMVLFGTSLAVSVIFFFYEIYLLLSIQWANRCSKDCVGLCANLERDKEQMYDASHNLVGEVARIRNEMKIYVKDPGCAALNDHFRHYQELSGVLIGLDQKIEDAHQNRDQRDEAYSAISEDADFKDLRKYFNELTGSICGIDTSIAKKNAASRNLRVQWWVGVWLALAALVAAALILQNALGT